MVLFGIAEGLVSLANILCPPPSLITKFLHFPSRSWDSLRPSCQAKGNGWRGNFLGWRLGKYDNMLSVRRLPRGFWLSEILTSVWLLTFVGAGLLGLFLYLAKTSKLANDRAVSELLAENILDRALRIGPPTWGLDDGQVGEIVPSTDSPEGVNLTFQLKVTELEKHEEHRLGGFYHVSVEISWNGTVEEIRGVERGRGRLVRERDVYVEDLETDAK